MLVYNIINFKMNKQLLLNLFLLVLFCLLIAVIVNFFKVKNELENFREREQDNKNKGDKSKDKKNKREKPKIKKNKKTFDEWNKDENQKLQNMYNETLSKEKGLPEFSKDKNTDKEFPLKYMVKPYKIVEKPENCPKCENDCSKCVPDCSKCMGAYKSQYFTYKNKDNNEGGKNLDRDGNKKFRFNSSKDGYKMWF